MAYTYILVGIVVALGVFGIVATQLGKRNQKRCPKCKLPYKSDGAVEWKVVSTTRKENGAFLYNVHFVCKCNKCGGVQEFDRSFKTYHTNSYGDTTYEPLETVIERFFSE